MAWDLQTNMHSYIAPTVALRAREADDYADQLATWYADQRWDEDTGDEGYDALGLDDETVIHAIADKAIEHGAVTNGGGEVYLDGWTSLEWCSEDDMLAYFG